MSADAMADPTLPLQKAMVARLKANSDIVGLVGAKVFDSVPPSTAKPYVNMGLPQVLPDKADCVAGAEVMFSVHGWSAGPDTVEVKRIGAAILRALDEAEDMVVDGHHLTVFELEQMDYLNEPDGIVKHVSIVFRALTEPTA